MGKLNSERFRRCERNGLLKPQDIIGGVSTKVTDGHLWLCC